MENLVAQLKKINFQPDLQNRFTQNNAMDLEPLKMSVKSCFSEDMNESCSTESPKNPLHPLLDVDENDNATDDGERETSGSNETDYESDEKKEDDLGDKYDETSNRIYSGIHAKLRKLPQRASKLRSDSLRTPMKPSKVTPKSKTKLHPSSIEKLYTNQKLTKLKRTNLETIFEEPQTCNVRGRAANTQIGEDSQCRSIFGSVKHRRFLNCCDGFNINKTLVKHRRAMIKKNFGRRHAWKKMPLDGFLQHLKERCHSESEEEHKTDAMEEQGVSNANPMPMIVVTRPEEEVMED